MDKFVHNGVTLEYEVSGTGLPFVFLHGMGGSVEQIRSVYEPVRGIRLISMNQQGHGNSGVDWDNYDFDHLGDDVIALLDHIGVEKAVLGGISMGAAVSLNAAVRYPKRVLKLLLIRNAWTDHPMPEDVRTTYHYGSYLAGQIADASFVEIPDKHPALAIDARKNLEKDAKYIVAKKAVRMIRPDTLVAIDGGSTNVLFASLMPLSIRLRVVTNSFPVANELRKRPHIDVIFLGGTYNKESQTTVGDTAIQQLQGFHFDQCFLGAYAIDIKNGISVPFPYEDEAAVKRYFVTNSSEVHIMGACSKLNKVSNYVICPVEAVTKILCEHPVTGDIQTRYLNKIM